MLNLDTRPNIKVTGNGTLKMDSVLLNDNPFICASNGSITLGKNVTINRNTIIVSKEAVSIGENSSIGPNVCIYDHGHCFGKGYFSKSHYNTSSISIGEGCWIGAGVIILKGSKIGNHCVIAAGTVIRGEIPDYTLVHSNSKNVYCEISD